MNGKRGFSLVEILIVVAILVVIGGMVSVKISSGEKEKAYYLVVRQNLNELAKAVSLYADDYYRATGTYPTSAMFSYVGTNGILQFYKLLPYVSKTVVELGTSYKISPTKVYYADGSGAVVNYDFGDGKGSVPLSVKWSTGVTMTFIP